MTQRVTQSAYTGFMQAGVHLMQTEGSKMVMALCQSSYNQGVYGLVTNLGSLVVRTIFFPVEEAAFRAFSRPPGGAWPSHFSCVLVTEAPPTYIYIYKCILHLVGSTDIVPCSMHPTEVVAGVSLTDRMLHMHGHNNRLLCDVASQYYCRCHAHQAFCTVNSKLHLVIGSLSVALSARFGANLSFLLVCCLHCVPCRAAL